METRRQAITVIRMKHIWIFLLLGAATAEAETVYRCVKATGAVSYQAQACKRGARLDRTIHYVRAPGRIAPRDGGETSRATPRDDRSGTHVQFARRSASVVRSRITPDRCGAAKIKRQNALARLGLWRTYDQLSRLDDPVRAACGGF